MRQLRIFIDLDDVCNDFTLHALRAVGCPVRATDYHVYDPEWGWDIVKAANELHPNAHRKPFTNESFWEEIVTSVWTTAPRSDLFLPLISMCMEFTDKSNICLLTSPTADPFCLVGKEFWIRKNCPKWLHRQFLIGTPKHLCAHREAVLIDDRDENVKMFRKYGGNAILVPRPWNTLHAIHPNKAAPYIRNALESFTGN